MPQKFVIPFFLLIALSILFLGHYFIYFSVVHFFGIAAPPHRAILAAVLLLLALSFFASSFLAHWSDTFFARAYYFVSSLWIGAGLTLITALAFAWLAWAVSLLFLHNSHGVWFGSAAVALASIYTAYGVWNAYHPRVVNVAVRLKNLPPAWRGKRIVQISDVHLGRILGARFLQRIVTKVNAEAPELVVITGDLFDGTLGHLEQLVAPLRPLHAPRGIYFVTGNHESYLGVGRSYAALESTPVTILADQMVMIDGLQVIGISYPERGQSLILAGKIARLSGFDPVCPPFSFTIAPPTSRRPRPRASPCSLPDTFTRGRSFPFSPLPG